MSLSLRSLTVLVALAASVACTNETSAPVPVVAGTYNATAFITTANGVTTDQLMEGVTLTITLTSSGTTTGSLSVPGVPAVDMAGTWALVGDTVHFEQNAETFVRLTPFEVGTNQLRGERTTGGLSVRVTLSK